MVLESIVIPAEMERHPKRMFYIGFIYSTVGLLLGLFIFGKYASLAGIFLTTMPLLVILYRAIELEERKDILIHGEFSLMKEHRYILSLFIYLFVGMVVSYALWFFILPTNIVKSLFDSQIETIESITGGSIDVTGSSYNLSTLELILFTNIRVWVFCILFSFLYGSGAIFILTWNASIIGVAAGNILRKIISSYAGSDHYTRIYNYFMAFPISFSYLVHGIPEVSAYFLGALGGGIISVAVIKHNVRSKNFRRVLIDSLDLWILSFIVLVLSALIEVYVTPSLM
ncbi:MAG: stage II sporulation protein M [Candidatus Altiarchaeota archaeon]